ncbi:hypothetical protein SARC_04262 [Sphaeroforma arctica JP610]|uniref:Uncharacterized protein n=1 Tax=Sphaeroforma arctica JP610 TaxID=667725 RepID=A0A0L0G3R8_9EUKA|nr:hypothetical protein SARC_04262 [Sphaeroforma arctica JP610]KNC83481.1 hypothetical protein SARC_04262 [Sphaeroforma arctica JP610]|eukprot:XP_014157383.1 hypothetical protein SARC_04262 [Sphaeroforma arctica JP610]
MDRSKYGKTDGKGILAKPTSVLVSAVSSGLAIEQHSVQDYYSLHILYATTAMVLFCGVLMLYATIVYVPIEKLFLVGHQHADSRWESSALIHRVAGDIPDTVCILIGVNTLRSLATYSTQCPLP